MKKSKEALELSNKNMKLQAEVKLLNEELAKKDEELIQKGEELVKEREALTNDAVNSYMAGFEDVVAQRRRRTYLDRSLLARTGCPHSRRDLLNARSFRPQHV